MMFSRFFLHADRLLTLGALLSVGAPCMAIDLKGDGVSDSRVEALSGTGRSNAEPDRDSIQDGNSRTSPPRRTVFSSPGVGVPATGELAGKLVRYNEEGTPVAVRAFGVNYYDAFQRTLRDVEDRSFVEGFDYLREHNIPVARVLFAGFWPSDWDLYFTDKKEFYRRLDDFVEQAERRGVGIIFSMFWAIDGVGEMVDRAVTAGYLDPGTDFTPPSPLNVTTSGKETYAEYRTDLGRADSGSTAFIAYVTKEVVERYKDSPTLWGWEFSNENNLAVDLPNIHKGRPVSNAKRGFFLKRDPPSVPPYAGEDDFKRADMEFAKSHFAAKVREHDPWRFTSSGDSRPRPSAYKNWQTQSWGISSRAEMMEVLPVDNPGGINTISIHLYPVGETYFSDEPAVSLAPETGDYAAFLGFFQDASAALEKPLFLGEWGVTGDGASKEERITFHRLLQAVIDANVQISLLWSFDNRNPNQVATHWVNPGTPKEYMLQNDDPELWDLQQANGELGAW